MKIKKLLLEYVSPDAPKESRLKAAQGSALLTAAEMVTALVILSFDKDEEVASVARETFKSLHFTKVACALTASLDPFVIEEIYRLHAEGGLVLNMMVLNENTPEALLIDIATRASDSVLSILSHSEKMIGNVALLEAVKDNTLLQPATLAASMKTFALATPEAGETKVTGLYDSLVDDTEEAPNEEEEKNLFKKITSMSVVQKIKLAMIGNREARNILLNESNKVILKCVIRNPRITEEEVMNLASSKTVSDEILRDISNKKEWMKSYNIQKCLVFNPKTPVPVGIKYLKFMREKDVRLLSTSRAVSNALRSAAVRRLAQMKSV